MVSQAEGDAADRAEVRCDVFTALPVSSGRTLLESALSVEELDRKAVEFRFRNVAN